MQPRAPLPDRPPRWAVAGWRGFKRLTQLGLPRRFPIAQFPNEPLIASLVAGIAAKYLHGLGRAYATAIGHLALAVWAYEELTEGVNWFRRLLGLAVIIVTVMTLAKALAA